MEIKKIASEYHTQCNDCGRFLKSDRWVKKNHPVKTHALCQKCRNDYD